MRDRMRHIHTIHFVGIGGSGHERHRRVLLNLGYSVQGSDLKHGRRHAPPQSLGARVLIGHRARKRIGRRRRRRLECDQRRQPRGRPGARAARPGLKRAEMLGELMRFRYSIAVAGTHGKTTTTSLVASVLAEGGEDPTFVIGGRLKGGGDNARLGAGRYLVAEADESELQSFMHLAADDRDRDQRGRRSPRHARRRLRERLKASFVEFLHNLPFYGLAVIWWTTARRRRWCRSWAPLRHYGFDERADVRAVDVERRGACRASAVLRPRAERPLEITSGTCRAATTCWKCASRPLRSHELENRRRGDPARARRLPGHRPTPCRCWATSSRTRPRHAGGRLRRHADGLPRCARGVAAIAVGYRVVHQRDRG